MKHYQLRPAKDDHGQPLRLFTANEANNVAKAINQLSGICTGILSDGVVTDQEAAFFAEWVRSHSAFHPVWPLTDILERVERVFQDGCIDAEERKELEQVIRAICGATSSVAPIEAQASTLPINEPQPSPILFENHNFCITGKFAFGSRSKVMQAIQSRKGMACDSGPTRETHYLVIGTFGSRDWIAANYGRKIRRAVELRDRGSGIAIVSEAHWRQFIT